MNIEQYSSEADSRFRRGFHFPKWASLLPCLFSAFFLAGCARHYDMILTNGARITNITEYKLYKEQGAYYYKEVDGKVHHIPAHRVVEIKPHSGKDKTPGTVQ
jgi:hypothetical protein